MASHEYPPAPQALLDEWPEWSPSRLPCDATVLAIAPRGAGKTTFLLDCIHYNGEKRKGIIVCPTPELYKTYARHFPLLFCFQHFDEEFEHQMEDILNYQCEKEIEVSNLHDEWVNQFEDEALRVEAQALEDKLQRLHERARRKGWSRRQFERLAEKVRVDHQKQTLLHKQERARVYKRKEQEMRAPISWFCLFDDLAYSKAAMRSMQIARAVKNGRHYVMQQFYATQSPRDFKCDNRDQIDVLAFSPLITVSNIKRFMEDFMPSGLTPPRFKLLLSTFAKYGWWLIVERRNVRSEDPHTYIWRYRAKWDPVVHQRVGTPEVHWLHRILFDTHKAAKNIMTVESSRPGAKNMSKAAEEKELLRHEELARQLASLGARNDPNNIIEYERQEINRARRRRRNEVSASSSGSGSRSRSRPRSRSRSRTGGSRRSRAVAPPPPSPPQQQRGRPDGRRVTRDVRSRSRSRSRSGTSEERFRTRRADLSSVRRGRPSYPKHRVAPPRSDYGGGVRRPPDDDLQGTRFVSTPPYHSGTAQTLQGFPPPAHAMFMHPPTHMQPRPPPPPPLSPPHPNGWAWHQTQPQRPSFYPPATQSSSPPLPSWSHHVAVATPAHARPWHMSVHHNNHMSIPVR